MSQPVPTDVRAPTLPLAGEERDWAARIRAGDTAAFERAFRTYHPALCKFACRYVHSRDVAQELVHDVFATLWEERARLRVGKLKSYLYAAVRNSAISHLRHERVERRWRLFTTGRAPRCVELAVAFGLVHPRLSRNPSSRSKRSPRSLASA